MDCSCAPMLRFFSVASDGATTDRQIQNRYFGQFLYQFEDGYRRQLCYDLHTVFDICYGTRCTLQRTKHFADPSVGGARRFENCGGNFAKRKQSGVEFAGNTTHGYY